MEELNSEHKLLNWNVKSSIFYFSKKAAEAAYVINIMKNRVTWKNQLTMYMTVKLHSPLTRGQSFAITNLRGNI